MAQEESLPTLPEISNESQDTINTGLNILNDAFRTDIVQNKFHRFLDIVDLKIRTIRFITSLLTQENFILLRRFLEVLSRTTGNIASFLPNAGDSGNSLLRNILSTFSIPVEPDDSAELRTNNSPVASRINRQATQNYFTNEEQAVVDTHQDQVNQLTRLIYRTP